MFCALSDWFLGTGSVRWWSQRGSACTSPPPSDLWRSPKFSQTLAQRMSRPAHFSAVSLHLDELSVLKKLYFMNLLKGKISNNKNLYSQMSFADFVLDLHDDLDRKSVKQ
jgi:hypothetical protein